MYFRPYPRINSRDMQDVPQGEMDVSHRFSQEVGDWLKGLFTWPSEPEDRPEAHKPKISN
jgi:hypothetical protein